MICNAAHRRLVKLELGTALLVTFQNAVRDQQKQRGPRVLRLIEELFCTQLGLPNVSHRHPKCIQIFDFKPDDQSMLTSKLDKIRHDDEVKGIEVIDLGNCKGQCYSGL